MVVFIAVCRRWLFLQLKINGLKLMFHLFSAIFSSITSSNIIEIIAIIIIILIIIILILLFILSLLFAFTLS